MLQRLRMKERGLRSRRVWVAAVLAVLATWFAAPVAVRTALLLEGALRAMPGLPESSAFVAASVLHALFLAAAIEGCRAATLIWPLRRDWESWAPLGAAFGILKAVGVPAA